jgi:hypothetical protein
MPLTKTIEVPSVSVLTKLLHYVEDEKHRNHAPKGYHIPQLQSAHPDLTRKNFVPMAKKIIEQLNAGIRGGAPVKNLATLHIIRVPYHTYLTPRERRYFALRYIRDILPDGLALYNWHINPLHGSDDLNIMALNATSLEVPRTRRQRNINPIADARRVSDLITDRLNARRRALGQELIITMQEVQQDVARERRDQSLEEQLAALPTRITLANLREEIEKLGHTVNRFNPDKNYLTVRFKTSKPLEEIADKKKRKRASRGNRFDLVDMLLKVWLLRRQKRHTQLTQAKAKPTQLHPPQDQTIQSILEQEKPRRKLRPPEPPQDPPAPPKLWR